MMLKLQGQQPSRQGRPFLAGFISLTLTLSLCPTAFAQTTPTLRETQIGASCTKYAHATDFDTLAQCNNTTGGTMQKAPLFIGAVTSPPYTTTTCDANKAGMIQYVGVLMQYCNGTSWTTIATGSLGASAAATNPSRSDDVTTGLFSSTASTVSIATAGTERLRVTSSGYVGIGTTGPAQLLHVYSTTNSAAWFTTTSANGKTGESNVMLHNANSTAGNSSAISAVNSAIALTGFIDFININQSASGSQSGAIAFSVPNAGTWGTPMYIGNDGNVGIGTTAPKQKLDVSGDVNIGTGTNTFPSTPAGTVGALNFNGTSFLRMVLNDGTGNFVQYLNSYYDSTAVAHKYMTSAPANRFITSGGTYQIDVAPTGTAGNNITWTTALGITNGGYVGVGTTAPSAKLEVADLGAASFRVGTTDNRTNGYAQVKNSLHVWSTAANAYSEIGAVDLNFFNAGSSSTFAGLLNRWYGASAAGTVSGIANAPAAASAAEIIAQNSSRLAIGTNGTGPIQFYNGGYGTFATFDSTGHLGLGTTAPAAPLDVSSISTLGSASYSGGTNFLRLFAAGGSAFSEPAIAFQESGTNIGAKIGVKNTANGAYSIIFSNRDTSSTTSTQYERMRIESNGNVGIGTTTPTAPFEIYKTAAAPAASGTTTTALMRLHPTNTNSILDVGVSVTSPYAGWLQQTDVTNLGLTYPLALNPNGGNVGIGTTAPVTKLDIASGEVKVGSSGAACSTTNAGAIRWSGSAFEGCNGTSWTSLGGGTVAFGSPTAFNLATVYQAATAGIVVVSMKGTFGENCAITGTSDSATTPTTVVAQASSVDSYYASITFPVKKNDYYTVTYSDCTTSGKIANFYPLTIN